MRTSRPSEVTQLAPDVCARTGIYDLCPIALEHTGTLPLLNPVLLLEISFFVVSSLRIV